MFDQKFPRRVRAFTGAGAEQRAERVGHFFRALAGFDASQKWCVDHKIALRKAQVEGVDSAGGFLAPDDFDDAVIAVREAVGAFRQGAQVRPLRSDSGVRPRRVGGLTASFVAEGAAIPESSFTLDAVGATAKKMAILARASNELFEDAAADVGEFVTAEIGYAFAALEDDCGFSGDGTQAYAGILGLGNRLAGLKSAVAAASGHDTFLEIDSTDVANLIAGVMAAAIPGAAWYVSATGYGQVICRLSAVTGGLVASQRPDGTISASYLGFPVIFSGKLPDVATTLASKPMLYFGNLALSSVIAERRGLTVATSIDRAIDADQILLRGTGRGDIINHTVGSASAVGPIAALIGTS